MRTIIVAALSLALISCECHTIGTAQPLIAEAEPAATKEPHPSPPDMKSALRDLLETMDRLADRYDELGETNNREPMHLAIYHGLVAQTPNYVLPKNFYLGSDEANQAVRQALERFLADAIPVAKRQGLTTHAARYNAFQDASVKSKHESTYDDYFGHWPHPDRPPGNW